jgi:hypothetical protein
MRIIGQDTHRAFAEAVAWDDGKLKRLGLRRHAPASSRGFGVHHGPPIQASFSLYKAEVIHRRGP